MLKSTATSIQGRIGVMMFFMYDQSLSGRLSVELHVGNTMLHGNASVNIYPR